MVIRSCQVTAEDPQRECASQEEITNKADKVAADLYYRYLYFNSDTYGKNKPNGFVKT